MTSVPAWSPRTSNNTWGGRSRTGTWTSSRSRATIDRRISVTTPLQKAGAYLLTARMEEGNTSRIVVWLDDTVIVKKPLAGKTYYFIADARTGQPVPRADVELFGWRRSRSMAGTSSASRPRRCRPGRTTRARSRSPRRTWSIARGNTNGSSPRATTEGRFAHLGFTYIWNVGVQDPAYNQVKVYPITDRPVYRPGAPVRFKFWIARARYDEPDASEFAGSTFTVEIHNPKGEKVFTKDFKADAFGGFDGSFELPSDATLGVYQVLVANRGGGSFRVEEYKKPEFEVNVEAPKTPVMLGEKVAATIKANYYFGGAGRRGEGQVQDHPHDGRRPLVSRRPLGLALRPRLLVVRRRFLVVSRLVALGDAPARRLVVGTSPGTSRSRGRSRGADPARRHDPRRDRHGAGQGGPPRSGPSLRDHGRDHRPVAADDRRHRDRAGRPQALHRLYLGRSRALSRRRHDRGRESAPRPSTASRSPARGRSSCSRSPTTPSAGRSRRPWRAGT